MSDRLPSLPAYDAPPLHGQLTDLLLFGTPDLWFNRITELNDQVTHKIEEFGTAIGHKIDGLSTWDAAKIGAAVGLIGGGPFGAVVGGIEGAVLVKAVKAFLHSKLNGLLEDLWEAHKKLVDAMQAAIDAIFGNPEKLMGLGTGYVAAKAQLNNASQRVNVATDDVAIFWDGRGATAYAGAAGQQKDAMDAMADKMTSAGHLMADAAEMIQKCWSDIIQALVALVTDIAGDLIGDISITELPTAEVKAPVQVILDAVNFLNAVVKSIRDVNISARNSGVMNWTDLNSGDKALDAGAWPEPSGLASATYKNHGNWGPTER